MEHIDNLIILIKKNKPLDLEWYIKYNDIDESLIKNESFDLLIFALENNASSQIVETILSCFPKIYNNINYVFKNCSPFVAALKTNNLKVANILLQHKADINFSNERMDNALFYLLQNNLLNKSLLKYLLRNNIDTKNNKFFYKLIYLDNSNLLEIYLSEVLSFDNNFIIDILYFLKNKASFNKSIFDNKIKKKNKSSKIKLDNEVIYHICFHSFTNIMDILLKYKIFQQRIISYVNQNFLINKIYSYGFNINLFYIDSRKKTKNLLKYGAREYHLRPKLLLNLIRNNDLDLIKMVMDKGAYIYNMNDDLLILKAYKYRNNDIIKYLLRHGVNLHINDIEYEKLLELAEEDKVDILPYLDEYYKLYKTNTSPNPKTLTYAIKNKNVKIAKHLLQTNSIPYNKICEEGNSSNTLEYLNSEFMFACEVGNVEIVKLFLDKGIDPNHVIENNGRFHTPLTIASKNNNDELVNLLYDYGAQYHPNIKIKSNIYTSPMTYAIYNNSYRIIKALIEKWGVNINKIKVFNGIALLMHYLILFEDRVSDNNINLLNKYIQQKHIDINKQNQQGETALHLATKMNMINSIKYLVESGANTNIRDSNNKTPLVYAVSAGHKESVTILISNSDCDVNAKSYNVKTVLMYAFENGNIDIAECLINNVEGIVVDLFCHNGNSILIYACLCGHLRMVKYLVNTYSDKGIVNAKGVKGKTPLMIASEYGHFTIAKYLIYHGATINASSHDGNTALIYAVMHDNTDIINLLLEHHPEIVNMENNEGETALTIAAYNGNLPIIKILRQFKGNMNHKDKKNGTVLMNACYSKNSTLNLIKYIEKHCSNKYDVCDEDAFKGMDYGRCTAYDIACKNVIYKDMQNELTFLKFNNINNIEKDNDESDNIYIDDPPVKPIKKKNRSLKKHHYATKNYYSEYLEYLDSFDDNE